MEMDIVEILKALPHRYPILMIDKVLEIRKSEYIKAIKNVTINEPFFPGHYPKNPIMPGVMILEAMAQAGACLAIKSDIGTPGKMMPLFAGVEKARFRAAVKPGDVLVLEATVEKSRRQIWWLDCTASVDGKVVTSGKIQAVLADFDE